MIPIMILYLTGRITARGFPTALLWVLAARVLRMQALPAIVKVTVPDLGRIFAVWARKIRILTEWGMFVITAPTIVMMNN
jgi:hypothetical protein